MIVGCRSAYGTAWRTLHANDKEIGEAVSAVRSVTGPSDVIVARKPHVRFYAEREKAKFPVVTTLEDLERDLRLLQAGCSVFVYYGSAERQFRPALRVLSRPDAAPPWLTPVATSEVPGRWVLYRLASGPPAGDGTP